MSDQYKEMNEEELDKVSGGVSTHPFPRDPIKPGAPPTHPGGGDIPIGGKRTNPVGGG
ncbi:MAG TPA: bacteriocin [Candidatus Cybelea sp.]|jgi:bacteriocin-like protein